MSHLRTCRVYRQVWLTGVASYRLAAEVDDAILRDQMRRLVTSMVVNIVARCSGATDAGFARFLAMARRSTSAWSGRSALAVDLGLVGAAPVRQDLDISGRMLNALIWQLRAG